MSGMEQSALLADPPEEPEQGTVYVVAANYADDPHPHIEGVFSEKGRAKDLMDDCRKTTSPPYPVAWQMFETEIDGEVSVL